MTVRPELLKGSLALMVLRLVECGDTYGYQLIKDLEAHSGGVFQFKEGTLYPVLHGLERDGHIENYWGRSEVGRRRKYYRITSAGRAELQAFTAEWAAFTTAVNDVLNQPTASEGGPS